MLLESLVEYLDTANYWLKWLKVYMLRWNSHCSRDIPKSIDTNWHSDGTLAIDVYIDINSEFL